MALTPDVDTFLVSLLARFKLTKWATGDLDSETAVRADEFVEHCNGLAEQWLSLLIAMAGERFMPGVGEGITPALALRREAIQVLCVEPLSHSSLLKKLPEKKRVRGGSGGGGHGEDLASWASREAVCCSLVKPG